MRKLALFVLFFGAGIAILLATRSCTDRPRPPPPPPRDATVEREQFTEIPITDEREGKARSADEHTAIGILPDGPMEVTQFAGEGATRKRERLLRWDDVDPVGDNVYEVKNLEITIFDLETGEVAARVRSPKTRMRVTFVHGRPTIGEGDRVVLSQVDVDLYKGVPITPLTMRVPRLEWIMSEREFASDERVELIGSGFEAEGVGLRADLDTSTVKLLRQGLIKLSTETSAEAILAADGDGPIVVSRGAAGNETALEVAATGGARFGLTGDEPLQVKATDIHLVGRTGAGAGKGFALTAADARGDVVCQSRGDTFRAQAADFAFGEQGVLARAELQGNVVLQGGDNTFRADHAAFDFGPGGRLSSAKLDGSPNASVGIGRIVVAGEIDLHASTAELSGTGPLWVDFGERTGIRLAGPGEVRVPDLDFQISAAEELRGSVDTRDKSGELNARGTVRVRYQAQELESDALAMNFATRPDGERVVDGRTEGLTVVKSRTDTETFTMRALGGLEVSSREKLVQVTAARDVELDVEGARSFHARADVVRDLDLRASSFVAEGAVEYRDRDIALTAQRATVKGRDELLLDGGDAAPAKLRLFPASGAQEVVDGEVEAREIHVVRGADDTFDARGNAKADLATADTRYQLRGDDMHVVRRKAAVPPASAVEVLVNGNVSAAARSSEAEVELSCQELHVEGDAPSQAAVAPDASTTGAPTPGTAPAPSRVRALRDVRITYTRGATVRAEGDLLVMEGTSRARLSAEPGNRVRAVGRIDPTRPPYALTADWLELVEGRVHASNLRVDVEPPTPHPQAQTQSQPTLLHMWGDDLAVDEREVRLTGHAHADGVTRQGEVWSIDAGSMRIQGDFRDRTSFSVDNLSLVEAREGFLVKISDRLVAEGDTLSGRVGEIRLEGRPAKLTTATTVWQSAWIEYDMENMMLATDKGVLLPAPGSGGSPWSVTYESMQPFDRGDTTILALRNPVFREMVNEMRSDWVLLWIDREEWRTSGQRALSETSQGPSLRVTTPERKVETVPKPAFDLLARFQQNPLFQVLSEVYFEGSIEFLKNDERIARAAAIYIDLKEARGWVQDADVLLDVNIRGEPRRLRAKAQWMRVGADGSLRADRAVITACDHDDPHYVIETGDLRLTRNRAGALGWNVAARKNAIRFGSAFSIPLPPLVYETDKKGNPLIESLILGNSSKFGAQARATFNFTLGKVGLGVGKVFGTLLDLPETDLDGHWKFNAGYLGSRGVLLGVGLELEVPEQFNLDLAIDGIPDDNEDKGLIRVPPEDRATLRDWFRARGRYYPEKTDRGEWFDLAVSLQSDPGVQSEFFERDFLEYEQKDNYVHWRKAKDQYYFNGTAKVVLENRTDVEELPQLGAFRGRTPITEIGSRPVLYTAYAFADYAHRVEGDPEFYPPFPDDLGERSVARFDTSHRLEMPVPLGVANVRATPFVSARATAWSEGADAAESPTRGGVFAGVELGTTMWRRFGNGTINTIAPSIGVRTDIATGETGGDPVQIDRIEDPDEGTLVDFDVVSKWWKPNAPERFDVDLRATHLSGAAEGEPDGLLPVAVLAELLVFAGDVPVGISHDGRYEIQDGQTVYSRSFLGFEPSRKLGIELGYHRGVDDIDVLLYEAASLAARYRATKKWEIELEQTLSFTEDTRLSHNFILRRIGHDFITEIEAGFRAGEGSSFGIKVVPLLSWKRSGLGLIDRWLGTHR